MNQRIRVTGIVKSGDGILILKRRAGRSGENVFWELPTGKINFGEQPEEAMERALEENLGVVAKRIAIRDVVTFVASEAGGSNQLSNLFIVYDVVLPEGVRIEATGRYSAYKFLKKGNSAGIRVNEATATVLSIESGANGFASRTLEATAAKNKNDERDGEKEDSWSGLEIAGAPKPRETANAVTIYVDGASRGNPGPSGVGYYAISAEGKQIGRGGEFIGFATSRVAEYMALKKGIQVAKELGLKRVKFVSDSLMLVNQLNGVFTVKNNDLKDLYSGVKRELREFESYSIVHVKRLANAAADKEAGRAIDRMLGRKRK